MPAAVGAVSGTEVWVGNCTRTAVACVDLTGASTGVSVTVGAMAAREVAGAGPGCSVSHAAAAMMSKNAARIRFRIGDPCRAH